MAHRKSNPPTADWSNSLNLIDVVFAGSPTVVRHWHDLYDTLMQTPMSLAQYNSRCLTLLSSMARDLGYKSLEQVEIDKYYTPQAHGNLATRQEQLQEELLRVLKASKNMAEGNSEKS